MSDKFELGDSAKDIVSGFTGVCVARFVWLNGCVRYELQPPKLKDGKPVDPMTFDEGQLDPVNRATVKVGRRATGGPVPTPKLPGNPR